MIEHFKTAHTEQYNQFRQDVATRNAAQQQEQNR